MQIWHIFLVHGNTRWTYPWSWRLCDMINTHYAILEYILYYSLWYTLFYLCCFANLFLRILLQALFATGVLPQGYDISFLITNYHCEEMQKQKLIDFIVQFMEVKYPKSWCSYLHSLRNTHLCIFLVHNVISLKNMNLYDLFHESKLDYYMAFPMASIN